MSLEITLGRIDADRTHARTFDGRRHSGAEVVVRGWYVTVKRT